MLLFGSQTMINDVCAQHFAYLKDPPQTAKISYALYDILFLSICAIITGCEGRKDFEDLGKARHTMIGQM